MFTASFSYKEEYSRLISAVLLDVIEGSRQGDLSLAEAIGLDLNSVKTLNSLKAEQLHTLSRTYSQYKKGHSLFNIDTSRIRNIIAAAATESEILETIDQYILYGASNSIIEELFGYTSIQIATRKKVLGIKTPKGPKKQISPAEKKHIYDEYIETMNINDLRIRYLVVAKQTKQTIHNVYMTIIEIVDIENKINTLSKLTA